MPPVETKNEDLPHPGTEETWRVVQGRQKQGRTFGGNISVELKTCGPRDELLHGSGGTLVQEAGCAGKGHYEKWGRSAARSERRPTGPDELLAIPFCILARLIFHLAAVSMARDMDRTLDNSSTQKA